MTGGHVTVLNLVRGKSKEEDRLARWSPEGPDRSEASGQVLGHAGMAHAWVRGWSRKAADGTCCLLGFGQPCIWYTLLKR